MSEENSQTLGFVMMLDVSGSMSSWIEAVKLDACAFVDCLQRGDQLAINKFNEHASWIYPSGQNPDFVTITDIEQLKAVDAAIQKITSSGSTNIGEAIELANQMIQKATTDVKAFVLLSDGDHNTGTHPKFVLGAEPPIYVAGLGQYLRKEYFDEMLAKNAKSKYYNAPNQAEMMTMFYQILADASEANLSLNKLRKNVPSGRYYIIEEFTITSNLAQVCVVWSDKKFRYTNGMPEKNRMSIILCDPDGRKKDYQPEIDENGYCIFNLMNAKPGKWNVFIQYNNPEPFSVTVSAIDRNAKIKTEVAVPLFIEFGEIIPIEISVTKNEELLQNLTIRTTIAQSVRSIDETLSLYSRELDLISTLECEDCNEEEAMISKLKILEDNLLKKEGIDLFEKKYSIQLLQPNSNGYYRGSIEDTLVPGIYNIDINIEGIDPETGIQFTSLKQQAVFVR